MDWNILYYLLFGFVMGIGEFLPVSASAHGYLIGVLTGFEAMQPAILLAIHAGGLIAVCIYCRRRLGHISREMRIWSLPEYKRKRPPDTNAVLDGKVVLTSLIPMAVGIGFSVTAYRKLALLPILSAVLLLAGIVLYIPQYLPGANKDSRSLSRKDSLVLGLCGAIGVIPGLSRTGTMLSVGLMKGCDRGYILDITLLASIPALFGLMIVDTVMLVLAGTVLDSMMLIYCLLAAGAAFGGAWLAMSILRFLSVKSNFGSFAYYNWGLALFSFLVYLMI